MCLNETYSKVRISKYLYDSFPIQNSLLLIADDVILPDNSIDTINKTTESLIDATKEVSLEVNVEETKYMLLSRHQNAGQNRDIKIANRSFENVSQLIYFGTRVTNKNLIRENEKGIQFW
jgi:hypothetical protein